MKRLVPMFDNSGARYSIPEDRVDEFRADMGEVAEAKRYRGKDGQHFTIPQDQDDAFRADMPDAVPVRSYTMADGSRRDFTMSEMSKFLRSKEYRESEDYTPPQMGSPTWAAVKGALGGAAEGAYYGGKNALAKVATALPEAAASVGEAVGNAVNLGGNAKNAVGDWLRASGQQTKRWLGENIRGDQYDENGNLVMSGLTKDLGYEDALTKIGETAGDAAAMAVKFAPAAIAGPAYMETILASDGINAFADTFDRAKAAGYSDGEANLAGAASGLINYYGAKLMMKGGAATKDIANPLLRALGGTAFTGAATAAQAVGNKGVENAIESKPITEGMLGAAGEGFVEGAQFHLINEVGTNAKASMQIRRETREMKEMRKENLLTATETPDGRAFLNTVVQNEGVDAAIRARKDGKDVSRKMGAAADLPDNMSAAERNAVIDGISKAREAQAERVRTKMDDVQAQSLADEIGQNLMGGASDPMFEDIWLNATRRVKNAAELDEPGARARIVGEAVEDVVGKQLDAGPENRTDTPLEKKIAQNRSRIGQEQKAQRKAELDEYERQEQERIAREKAEQDAQMAEDERARAGQLIAEGTEANVPIRESSEYKSWLRKNGRTDTDKNFNRYVAERGLDASLKVERGHNGPNEQTKAELEMGRRIEAQGEAQRANAQAKYDEEMTRREEAKAKAARAAKEKQVAEDWAAAEADRKAKAQEASRKGQEERARRKKEMAEYEFGEEVRKAQEAAEERGGKPSISVGEGEVVPPLADSRIKDYPEYASWIKKQGRVNNDKNWNKFVLSNGLDPRLTVERNRGPKIPEKPVRPDSEASAPTKITKNPAQVDSKTPEKPVSQSAKPENRGEVVQPAKVPDGRGKMVEKPQTEQPSQPLENAPSRAPQEKGTTTPQTAAKPVEAQNGASGTADNGRVKWIDANGTERGTFSEEYVSPNGVKLVKGAEVAMTDEHNRRVITGKVVSLGSKNIKLSVPYMGGKEVTITLPRKTLLAVNKNTLGTDNQTPTPRVPDGKGRMVKKPAPKSAEQIADEYAAFLQKRVDRFNSAKTSKDFASVRDFAEGEHEALEAIKGNKEAIEIFNKKHADIYKAERNAVHDATTRENELRESERKAYEASDEGRLAKRDNAIATLQKGLGISLKSFLDGGWRIVKRTNGAVPRWSLVKEGANDYFDLSKKSVKKFMSEREHAESIKAIKEWYDAEDAKATTKKPAATEAKAEAETKSPAPTAKPKKTAATPEELKPLNDAIAEAKKPNSIVDADTAKTDENWGFRKATNAIEYQEQMYSREQYWSHLVSKVPYDPPVNPKTNKPYGKKTPQYAEFIANRKEQIRAVNKEIERVDNLIGKESPEWGDASDARADNIVAKFEKKYDKTKLSARDKDELNRLRDELSDALGEIELDELREITDVDGNISTKGLYLYEPSEAAMRVQEAYDAIERFSEQAGKYQRLKRDKDGRPIFQIDTATPADRTSDPAIVEWAKKRGETVATGADSKAKVSEETVRRFNADQIDKAVNVTKNLIKGVKVEQVGREWSEALDNPDGADKSVKLKREGRVVGTYDPATKKVRLYSGADASTVYHELVGHAVHDWAKDNAKPLYEKLNTLAKDAPKELVDEIRRNYPDADEATIAKEIIAHIAGKKGVENITPKLKDKPTTWYAKAYVTVRDAILDFMQKIGFRRIDVKKMDSMTPMEAMDYLTEQAAKGRMLGKAEATGDGALTKLEKWAVAMYDRYMPITKVSKDAADAKALQSGKEYDFQLRNFDVKKKEFGRILAEGDIAGESVADYMRAQSAPERNRRLREEFLKENKGGNPSDYDLWVQNNGGSGWSDERAAEHMKFFNSLPEARRNAIKKAADFLWKMQKEGMDRRVEAGLISREEADALMAAEQYHIPWRSAISEFDGEWRPWRGKNNFKSGEFAKAKGRATEAGDPIAWMFEEFSDAHLRAIENETRSILARDIEASGKFGKVIQNTPENQMKELRVKGGEGQANVVNFKRDGKTYSIVLEGERGDAIASSYTNRDLAHMPKKVQAFMRWWSSTATEWSPTFAVRNLVADNLDVARIVLAEQGVKQGVKTLAKYAVNRQRVAKEMWHYARTGEMKKGGILEQYSKEGGMIGGFQRQGYENLREQMSYENIRKQFEKDAKKGRNRTKSVLSLVPKAFVGIGHGIKTINTYAELSSRVAMFKTNVEAGMSAKDAALYSRRITVDFNRKGNYTPVLNTLFMFSNSTLGATMRQVEAIHKGWSTPQGKRAIALLFAQGLATAAAEAWINSDDDENEKQGKGTWKDMPEHNYTSRLGIRVGDKFYGLPGHDDPLSRISWLGSSVGRMFFGKMKKADFAKEIGSFGADMAGRFAGKGSTDVASGWNVLFPSAMQWFIQALENKDFAGRPIKRQKFDDAQPWSQNGRESTAQSWKTAAEILNSISGGNEARSGKLDFSPEMIRHTFNSVFKNVGRDAGDLIAMAEVGLQIADFDIRNAPIARNLVTKSSGNDNRFFEAQKAYKADANELKKRESWKPGEKAEYMKSHPWLREGRDGKTTVNRLINMTNRDNPRSGLGKMGITQLRKLTEGKVRHKDGTYFEPNTPISDEEKERAKEWLQKRQARVIEIMGK